MISTPARIISAVVCTSAIGLVAAAAAPSDAASWLDAAKPASWNRAGVIIPKAPPAENENPRCQSLRRPAETKEDAEIESAGWKLTGEYRGGWNILLIRAAAGHDGMCRPLQYQEFVFIRGKFAGTLSPKVMNSRTDGSLVRTFIESANRVRADYARYTASDALCCPSRTTTVVFDVTADAEPVVRPASSTTTPVAGSASK